MEVRLLMDRRTRSETLAARDAASGPPGGGDDRPALGVADVRAMFGAAEEVFAGLSPTGVQESDELYLLSTDGDNVKIRAELMDIKALREVDRDGLEQWEPVLKAGFPLTAADVTAVFAALGLPLPTLVRARLLAGGAPRRARRARRGGPVVSVHKRRVRYRLESAWSS